MQGSGIPVVRINSANSLKMQNKVVCPTFMVQ